jgi:hypothetical protein
LISSDRYEEVVDIETGPEKGCNNNERDEVTIYVDEIGTRMQVID